MNATLIINGKEYTVEVPQETMNALEPQKPKGKFIPVNNDTYYFVYECNNKQKKKYAIASRIFISLFTVDVTIVQNTPVFRTEDDAQEYIHYLIALDKHIFEPDWENKEQFKCCINFDWNSSLLYTYCWDVIQIASSHFFPSREAADAFIAEAGEDNVKKFMFDIWGD